MASLMAMAFHDPKKIDENLKPTVAETYRTARVDDSEWDNDEWWKGR